MSLVSPASFDSTLAGLKYGKAIPAPNATQVPKDIEKAAKDFDGSFLSEMLSHMFDGLDVDPMFGGGHGEEMFRGMLVSEYGKQIAAGPGIGISKQIQGMMIDMQQKMNGASK